MQLNKTIILAFIIAALALASCKKKGDNSAGGSWTFKSVTYKAGFANWVLRAFTGYTDVNIPTSALTFTFYDSISNATIDTLRAHGLPVPGRPQYSIPKNNTYFLSNQNPPDSGYVYVLFSDTSVNRYYQSQLTTSATVSVSRTADGKVSLDFSGLPMANSANPADMDVLSGTLKQTP